MKPVLESGLVALITSMALGCTLLDSDIGLREISDVQDCFGLSRYSEAGALACFELRDGQCEPVASMSRTEPVVSLEGITAPALELWPVPTAADAPAKFLLTAPKCEASGVTSIAASILEPGLGRAQDASIRVIDEKGRPWNLGQSALALSGADQAVLFGILTRGCDKGIPTLLTSDKGDSTRISLSTGQGSSSGISCEDWRGARWPALALSCERGVCSAGLAIYLAARACETDCERGSVECTHVGGDVSLVAERFRLDAEGVADRKTRTLGNASPVVAPVVLALDLGPRGYVVAHATEDAGACRNSKGTGIVLRTVDASGDASDCVHIPTIGVHRIAVGHGPTDAQNASEQVLLVWSQSEDRDSSEGEIKSAVVEITSGGLRVAKEIHIARDAALDMTPTVTGAERGATLDSPQGFWSVTWSSATTPKLAMVSRIGWAALEFIDTSSVSSSESGDAMAFAFHSDAEPVSYGVVDVDARNVASTWALKCAK